MPGRAGGVAPGGRNATHTESTLYLRRTCSGRRMTTQPAGVSASVLRSQRVLELFLVLLSNVVPGRSKAQRRRLAIATLAEMVGAIILARAVNDPDLSNEILAAISLNLSKASDNSHEARR